MRKNMLRFLAIFVIAFGVWMLFSERAPAGVSPEARSYLGNRTVVTLAGADRVEVFRVSPRRDPHAAKQIGGFPITHTGAEQSKEFALRLAATILRQDYKDDSELACNTVTTVAFRIWNDRQPDIGLRLWKSGDSVDVLLCYKCGEYSVAGKSAYGPIKLTKTTPFRPFAMRSELVRLAKQAFPGDKDIQALE
jgi:hypothetical protein